MPDVTMSWNDVRIVGSVFEIYLNVLRFVEKKRAEILGDELGWWRVFESWMMFGSGCGHRVFNGQHRHRVSVHRPQDVSQVCVPPKTSHEPSLTDLANTGILVCKKKYTRSLIVY